MPNNSEFAFGIALSMLMPWAGLADHPLEPGEARAIAKEAYIYGFPLVDHYRIQFSYFIDKDSPEYKGDWNAIHHTARVYTPADKAIQTPNSDTPYSWLGADLRAEPIVITVPKIENRRYYSAQFVDQYTFNFAYIGSRTSGNEAGHFLLAGPDWKGETPANLKRVLRCETQFAFVLFRTQLFGPDDLENVKKVQVGFKAQPLSRFLGQASPTPHSTVDFLKPLSAEDQRQSPEFFRELNFVLQFCPPNPVEKDILNRFSKLGIGGNARFDALGLSPELRRAVQDGIKDAWNEFSTFKARELDTGRLSSADGFGTREYLNGNYLARMASAVLGIYGNSKEEALYPAYYVDSDSHPLDGHHRYQLRFPPGQWPPVNAFWSLTLYELPASLLYENAMDRYLINSSMASNLKQDAGGGLTLLIQHESPAKELESNWLPAPKGPFWAILRLYWPKAEALNGSWKAPALVKID